MAKSTPQIEWCVVRLGDDHNWWVEEVSDPVRWDVDGLSIIDPRQASHILELVEPLRDYGFDLETMDRAFIPFRIDKDLGDRRVRLVRVKDSIVESDEKLFGLPDILDEENGPYADFLDHLTRARVKMLNDLFDFEQKLSVDDVEEEIREEQNANFIEGKAVHLFTEITAILDYVPAGWEGDEEDTPAKSVEEEDDDDFPEIDAEEDERLKNDESLRWDEDEEEEKEEDESGTKKKSSDDDDEDEDSDDEEEDDEEESEEEDRPSPKRRKR